MAVDALPVLGLTAPTLLLIGVLLVFTGRLIPRPTMVDMRAGYVAQIDALRLERDTWRAQAELSSRQVTELLPTTELATQILEELRKQAPGGQG